MNVLERFWHKSSLILPWMNFEFIIQFMKNPCLHNVDILDMFLKD